MAMTKKERAERAKAQAAAEALARRRFMIGLTIMLTIVVAVVVLLSASGLVHFAETVAGFEAPWSYFWPVMFDVSGIAFAYAGQYAARCGVNAGRCEWYARALVVLSAVVQMLARAAEDSNWSRGAVMGTAGVLAHGMAPVIVFGLAEVWQWAQRITPVTVAVEVEARTSNSRAREASEAKATTSTRTRPTTTAGKATSTARKPRTRKPADTKAKAPEGAETGEEVARARPKVSPAPAPVVTVADVPVALEDERALTRARELAGV